jgi:hypothetical protein
VAALSPSSQRFHDKNNLKKFCYFHFCGLQSCAPRTPRAMATAPVAVPQVEGQMAVPTALPTKSVLRLLALLCTGVPEAHAWGLSTLRHGSPPPHSHPTTPTAFCCALPAPFLLLCSACSVDSLGSADTLYTLNEPIIATFMRDLRRVGKKLKTVLVPLGAEADTLRELRDWDLWGPLLLCLVLSIITSARAPTGQHSLVFAGVFVLVWVGAAVVTLNAKLLGGKMCVRSGAGGAACPALGAGLSASAPFPLPAPHAHPPLPLSPSWPPARRSSFFQSVCVLGYCVCPLVIAAVLGLILNSAVWKVPIVIGAFLWSCRGA